MAIYYMTMSVMSGNKGQSAVAHSAYQSGDKLHDDADGLTKNYARKERVVAKGINAPAHAPAWATDRERLWNEVEAVEGLRGQYARNWTFALPNELTPEQQERLVATFIKREFVARGMVADWAIHRAEKGNEADNDHLHVMTTMRPFLPNGEWGQKSKTIMVRDKNGRSICIGKDAKGKKRYKQKKVCSTDWNQKQTLLNIRHGWADVCNLALENAGYDARIDERSYKERGLDILPQIHLGHAAAGMERRGERSRLGDINRAVAELNAERAKAKEKVAATAARTPETTQVDPNGTTCSSQPKAEKSPAPNFVIPTELSERMPFLFELQARLKLRSEELSKAARKRLPSQKVLDEKAHKIVQKSPELIKAGDVLDELKAKIQQNEERTKEVTKLLQDEYSERNAPSLWELIKGTRPEWNSTRKALINEKRELKEQYSSLKQDGFRASNTLESLQYDYERDCDAMASTLLGRALDAMPERQQAARADRAVKTIAKEIRTVRERGEVLAGTRRQAFTARYDGACHAVQGQASKTAPTASMKSIVTAITDGTLPASQITMQTDDNGLRNWSLMSELEKDEEMNKAIWKSI